MRGSGLTQRPGVVLALRLAPTAALISDPARVGGLMVYAPSGWGKSRLLGRGVCHQDARRRVGTVVLDVVGATIDHALDKLLYLPESAQQAALSRVRYCNMAGEEAGGRLFVPAWPMLAPRHPGESLYQTAQRLVDLIAKTDRALATASIQGLNRLAPLLTATASLLRALELPISAALDLLRQPDAWTGRLRQAVRQDPQAAAAARELQALAGLPPAIEPTGGVAQCSDPCAEPTRDPQCTGCRRPAVVCRRDPCFLAARARLWSDVFANSQCLPI